MGRLGKLSSEELDRLLAGKLASSDPDLERLGQLAQQIKAAHTKSPNPEVEASHIAAIIETARAATQNGRILAPAADVSGTAKAPSRLSTWKRVLLANAAASLGLKLLGGAVALAAGASGLAAIEALPEPAQIRVATAVEAVTPFELPGNEKKEKPADSPGTLQVEEVPPAELPHTTGNPHAEFGRSVAEEAKEGGVDGPETSQRAREQAELRREEGLAHRPPHQPAAPGHVPGPPAGVGPGSGHQNRGGGPENGMNRVGETPAGQHVPQNLPDGPPAGSRGPG